MAGMIVKFLVEASPRRFLVALLGFLTGFFACTAATAVALESRGLLPAPPLSYTNCIDEKLKFLHELPAERLEKADVVAVGSSTTLRNLDFSAWLKVRPDTNPVNIAPCYLHIDQTAYFAREMLKHMPNAETLLVVIHPRDFEQCRPNYRRFVPEEDIKAYIFEKQPMFHKYATNFRTGLVRDFIAILTNPEYVAVLKTDRFGSGPLVERVNDPYYPGFSIDPRCKPFVNELEDAAAEAGVRLVLVLFPILDEWANEVDPDRSKHGEFYADITGRLERESTLVIDGNRLDFPKQAYADPVHLLWEHTPVLTQFIARATVNGKGDARAEL